MAGLEADTSSYNQPLPVSPLEIAGKIGSLQQQSQSLQRGDVALSKEKLELIGQQFGVMNSELANLIDSGATKEQAAERMTRISKTLNLPPVATNHMMEELNAAPDVKTFAMNAIRRGMSTMEKYGVQLGTNENQSNGATNYQGVRQSPEKGGGFVPATQSAIQPPPTQPTVNNQRTLPTGQPNPDYLQPGIVGASGPPGIAPAPRTTLRRGLPAERPVSGPTGPTVDATPVTPTTFDNRFDGAFPNKIVTGAPPGTSQAIASVSEQSGKDLAADLTRAKNLQTELYPAERALELVKSQGPKAFGPGSEGLNTIKSAIATWLPNVDQKTIDSVSEFEQTRKYLTQIARASGATGTNDQLAAAFEANPSVKLNAASIENVLKSVIALRKMQAAQTLMAVGQNILPEQYSQWIAKNQNQFDARAFGVEMMDDKAKEKLYKSLKNDPRAFQKFEKTLQFAHDAELIGQ